MLALPRRRVHCLFVVPSQKSSQDATTGYQSLGRAPFPPGCRLLTEITLLHPPNQIDQIAICTIQTKVTMLVSENRKGLNQQINLS